jgi:putative IMPACT (imprinted ancient) family translation regulator
VHAPGHGEVRERGSRFAGVLLPASSAAEASALAAEIARQRLAATHHARAHRVLTPTGAIATFTHDAGEPAGAAGRPLLDALSGAEIVNAVLVVSRWFGGMRLGLGNLARAYADAARAAIEAAALTPLTLRRRVEVEAPFDRAGAVAAAAARAGASVEAVRPAGRWRATLLVPDERVAALERAVADATGGKARVTAGPAVLVAG